MWKGGRVVKACGVLPSICYNHDLLIDFSPRLKRLMLHLGVLTKLISHVRKYAWVRLPVFPTSCSCFFPFLFFGRDEKKIPQDIVLPPS